MKNMNPRMNEEDIKLLRFVRKANLDAFWARESGTVSTILRDGKKMKKVK